jgi:death-on-curing protein
MRYLNLQQLLFLHQRIFVDGNKRIGHAAMETFLVLNGFEILATVDEQEAIVLRLAAGEVTRDEWLAWLLTHVAIRSQIK